MYEKLRKAALAAVAVGVPLAIVKWRLRRRRRGTAREFLKEQQPSPDEVTTQDDPLTQLQDTQGLDVESLTQISPELPEAEAPEEISTTNTEESMSAKTLQAALEECDKVDTWSACASTLEVGRDSDDSSLVCYSFSMRHFACKAYLIGGGRDEGSKHLKLQTVFEDSRRELGEEQRYFIANEWNASKRYTRLKCGTSGVARYGLFTLEYDVLVPSEAPHEWGLQLLSHTLRMWYMSMVTCVMHIVERHDVPFATHEMITANTLTLTVGEEDVALQSQACPICLENFRPSDKVRRLPCLHVFHAECECNIDRHLVCDKTCPSCKTPIDIMERGKDGERIEPGASKDDVVYNLPFQDQQDQQEAQQPAVEVADAATETEQHSNGAGSSTAPAADVQVQTDVQVEGTIEEQPPSFENANSIDITTLSPQTAPEAGPQVATEGVAIALERVVQQGMQVQQGMAQQMPQPEAEELHRAVQSLQTRWNQMQDVVAGMQQMLRIIEESRALAGQLRNQQSQSQEAAAGNEDGQQQSQSAPGDNLPPVDEGQHHNSTRETSAEEPSGEQGVFSEMWRAFVSTSADAEDMARAWQARQAAQEASRTSGALPAHPDMSQPDSTSSDNLDGY